MPKRFIDTEIFNDEWFSDLSKDGKLFWIYFITNCDHAGILKVNEKLIKFQTGINSIETVTKELGNCFTRVGKELLFCSKFLKFQYPDFPKSKVMQQQGALKRLIGLGLWDETLNSLLTVPKELPNSYGNDNDNGNDNGEGGTGETQTPPIVDKAKPESVAEVEGYLITLNIASPKEKAEKFFNFYEAKGWMLGKNKIKSWKACVKTWEFPKINGASNETPQDRAARLKREDMGG